MHSIMFINPTSRPRPSIMAVVSQENCVEKMHARVLSCSIEEEDVLDNIEPNLVSAALTDSCSSHFSSDFRSYGDRFEVSAADPNNPSVLDESLQKTHEPKNYGNHDMHNPVDPFDDPMCSHQSRSKLSLSMHDLSKIPSFPLVSKQSNFSSETIQSQSITTVGSCPKSKDSGFPRSLSCLSLNSGRSYEHIQSKVKEYIKQIKAGNKTKRKLTYESATNEGNCCEVEGKIYKESTSPQILMPLINKLKEELDEKDRMLLKLQENYDALLMKYAAAENRIDHLRVNSVGNSFNIPLKDYKKPKASPNMLLVGDLQKQSRKEGRNCLNYRPEPAKETYMIGPRPLTNNTCLVNKLEEEIIPRLHPSPFSSTTVVSKEKNGRYSFHQNDNKNNESEQVKIETHSSGNMAVPKSPIEHQTSTPNSDNMTRPLNHQLENPFVKVTRWQESLPSLHLIEPSIYDQFTESYMGSELLQQKKTDKTGWSLCESDGVSLLTSDINVELAVDFRLTESHWDENGLVNVQLSAVSKENSVQSELLNPPPHLKHISLSNETDTDLDALKNLNDNLSCHTSHNKDTKNIFSTGNPNSVSNSVDSSSTFLCLEKASDLLSNSELESPCNKSSSETTSPQTRQRDMACENQSIIPFITSTAQNMPCITQAAQANDNSGTQNNLSHIYLPPIIAPRLHKNNLPTLPIIQPITKRLISSEPTNSIMPFVNLNITKEIGESNSLCRKRLLGQKARLLLMEYLKNSDSTCVCCTKENSNHLACNCSTIFNDSQIRKERRDSFEDKNVSLVQCLDEMNQCAQKLRGKSEAIMEVLAKQLRES